MNRTGQWLCLYAWLSALLAHLWSLASSTSHLAISGVDVSTDLVTQRNLALLWHILGVILAVCAVKTRKLGAAFGAASALLYLVVWYTSGSFRLVGPVAGYRIKWIEANTFGTQAAFLFRDGLLPAVFILALGILVWAWTENRPADANQ